MTVLTYYNGRQPKEKCWYHARRNQYYLLGDVNKKNSGGAYKFGNGKYVTKGYVLWSKKLKQYIRKKDSEVFLSSLNGKTDFLPKDHELLMDCYPVFDGSLKKFIKVLGSISPKNFKFSSQYGIYYVNCTVQDLGNHHNMVGAKKSYHEFPEVYNYSDMPLNIKSDAIKAADVLKRKFKFDEEFAKGLNKHSFGVEIETSYNSLPLEQVKRHGILPLKDGSISGNEFVTTPLSGTSGLRNLHSFLTSLERFAKVDHTCSYHVHIGNIKVDNKALFTAAFYTLYYELQNRLYELVPGHKTDIQVLKHQDKGKGKDYCKPLKGLGLRGLSYQKRYERILQWANDWKPFNGKFDKEKEQKWFKACRYYQVNLYNWLKNDGTIEFRLHHGILDPDESIMWICINNSIINYAIDNAEDILNSHKKYEIEDMINYTYSGEVAVTLINFVQKRRNFMNDMTMVGDNGVKTAYRSQGLNKFSNGGKNKIAYQMIELE